MGAVIKLPTAAPRNVENCRHAEARHAARALRDGQTIKFRVRPTPWEKARRRKFMGSMDDAGYFSRVYAVANLEGMNPEEVAAVRSAVEGGDRNELSDIALGVVLQVNQMSPVDRARLWPLFMADEEVA